MRLVSQEDTHLSAQIVFGARRLRAKEFQINPDEVEEIERSFQEQGSRFELASIKVDDDENNNEDSIMKRARCMYIEVSGPDVETIDQENNFLSESTDFALDRRQAASGLELLQTEGYTLFNLNDGDLTEIEEAGDNGCGFICEEMFADI